MKRSERGHVEPAALPPLYPGIDEGTVLYAIGDIHGRSDLLDRVQHAIDVDCDNAPSARSFEIYLGDYIDRGSDSSGVIARLRQRSEVRNVFPLMGNHEAMLLGVLSGDVAEQGWLDSGGDATALSYGVDPRRTAHLAAALAAALPDADIAFLQALQPSLHYGPYFFVHAGVNPDRPLGRQALHDLLWIRQPFLDHTGSFGAIVVHGHTPNGEPELRSNRINIDTGAFATNRLTCLRIDGHGVTLLSH